MAVLNIYSQIMHKYSQNPLLLKSHAVILILACILNIYL